MKKFVVRSIVAVAALMASIIQFDARAVTDKEMEQARTITAQAYLRYANDGSGYLDDLKPATTMAELEKNLKAKEQENIKAFKAVSVPKDYASWDKDKLVEYWSVTFFTSPGLTDKGKAARGRVKKKLSAMTVAAPAPAAEKGEEKPAAEVAPANNADNTAVVPAASEAEKLDAALPAAEEIISEAQDSAAVNIEDLPHEKKSSSNSATWIYVVALIVLVGVVVWLVIFASKTMQGDNEDKNRRKDSEDSDDDSASESTLEYVADDEDVAEVSALRDQRDMECPGKDKNISAMEREIHRLRDECLRLGEENGRLTSDLSEAKRELEALRGRLKAANAVTSAASTAGVRQRPASERGENTAVKAAEREIYLGRVNAKGLFVRADKSPVADKSVYVLVTQDGYTGSFRVIQSSEVVTMALDNPEYYLAGGCTAQNLADTDDANGIKTLSAGTAIFESGCWRVLRKSKITYI